MTTIKLDPATHDFVVENGSFAQCSEIEEIRQNVRIALSLFRGEVRRDVNVGMPFLEEIFAKGTDPARLDFIYREQILSVPGVIAILEGPDLEFDPPARKLTITFRAQTDYGDLIERGYGLQIGVAT